MISKENAPAKFNHLYKELDDIYHRLAANAGLSDSAFCVLYAIASLKDDCLQKNISDYYYLSRQTINSSVKSLKEKGYISLVKKSGRDKQIVLTEEGQRLVNKAILPVIKQEEAAFEEMPPADRQKLLELTERYIRIFQPDIIQPVQFNNYNICITDNNCIKQCICTVVSTDFTDLVNHNRKPGTFFLYPFYCYICT